MERKEDPWKETLGARDEAPKERYMEGYKQEKKWLKGVYI